MNHNVLQFFKRILKNHVEKKKKPLVVHKNIKFQEEVFPFVYVFDVPFNSLNNEFIDQLEEDYLGESTTGLLVVEKDNLNKRVLLGVYER